MSEKEREQNEKSLREYLNRKAEEQFFRMAAEEIDAEEDRLFAQAQELPDPDDETMARLEAGLQTAMKKARRRAQRRRWLHGLGRVAAGVAIVSGGLFAGAYLTVDATRNAVNNFVLEAFDGYAQMETEESVELSGPTMPVGWDGPFSVMWVPERFETVNGLELSGSWQLYYDDFESDSDMIISIWHSINMPLINTNDVSVVETEAIQNSTATIYYNSTDDIYMTLWTHNDYSIQIYGAISPEESKKILKNLVF